MSDKIDVSFIIPVANSEGTLKQCLNAISLDAKNYKYEIIVVIDGEQHDSSVYIAKQFATKVIELSLQRGHGGARNEGAYSANGDILFFIDSDVILEPGSTQASIKCLNDNNYEVVVGAYTLDTKFPNRVSLLRNLWQNFLYYKNQGNIKTFWSGCAAIKKNIFIQSGGFDERKEIMGTVDIEFGNSLNKINAKIILDVGVAGKHLKQWTFKKWLISDLRERALPWARLWWKNKVGDPLMTKGLVFKSSICLSTLFWILLLISLFSHNARIALVVLVPILLVHHLQFAFFVFKRTKNFVLAVESLFFITVRYLILGLGILLAILC